MIAVIFLLAAAIGCGIGNSNVLDGPPVINRLSPAAASAGSAVTLTISGSNFTSGCLVLWNGSQLPSTLVSSGQISATVSSSYVASPGTAQISVLDTANGNQSNLATFTIAQPPLSITTTSLPSGATGRIYSAPLTATGGTAPYSWSATGQLPTGLTLASSGTISGTPSLSGTYDFTVQVSDSSPVVNRATSPESITIAAGASQSPNACSGLSLGQSVNLNGFVPFPSNDLLNTDISNSTNYPVDPNSSPMISDISGTLGMVPDFGGSNGIPYYVVDNSQPMVNVQLGAYDLESDDPQQAGLFPVPIPPSAQVEGVPASQCPSGDAHTILINRDTCFAYELYGACYKNGAWTAAGGWVWDLQNDEKRPYTWTSADAAGLPILPLLVKYDEAANNTISHAVRFTVANSINAAVLPATHYTLNGATGWPPMGARLRLKPTFNIAGSGLSQINQNILAAMQKYGAIMADNGGGGSGFEITGTLDSRWNRTDLNNLAGAVHLSDFDFITNNPNGNPMTSYGPQGTNANFPSGSPPTISSFTSSAYSISPGQSVTLTWSTANSTYNVISGNPGLGPVRGTSATVTPIATGWYVLGATNQYGRTTKSVYITVTGSGGTGYADNFHRSSLGANWASSAGATVSIYNSSQFQMSFTGTSTGAARYLGGTFNSNQWSQIVIDSTANGSVGPAARIGATGADTYYAFYWDGKSTCILDAIVNGARASGFQQYGICTVHPGSALTLQVQGNVLSGWVDGVRVINYTDVNNSIVSGLPGIGGNYAGGTMHVGPWSGGNLAATGSSVQQPPAAVLLLAPNSGAAPLSVSASTAESSDPGGTIVSSSIDFGDGTVVNAVSASHTYLAAGNYTVAATVTDNQGASSTATALVTVSAPISSSTSIAPIQLTTSRDAYADYWTIQFPGYYAVKFGDGGYAGSSICSGYGNDCTGVIGFWDLGSDPSMTYDFNTHDVGMFEHQWSFNDANGNVYQGEHKEDGGPSVTFTLTSDNVHVVITQSGPTAPYGQWAQYGYDAHTRISKTYVFYRPDKVYTTTSITWDGTDVPGPLKVTSFNMYSKIGWASISHEPSPDPLCNTCDLTPSPFQNITECGSSYCSPATYILYTPAPNTTGVLPANPNSTPQGPTPGTVYLCDNPSANSPCTSTTASAAPVKLDYLQIAKQTAGSTAANGTNSYFVGGLRNYLYSQYPATLAANTPMTSYTVGFVGNNGITSSAIANTYRDEYENANQSLTLTCTIGSCGTFNFTEGWWSLTAADNTVSFSANGQLRNPVFAIAPWTASVPSTITVGASAKQLNIDYVAVVTNGTLELQLLSLVPADTVILIN